MTAVTKALPASFAMNFAATELAVRGALAEVLTKLELLGLDVEEAGTVELVLAEALNNIVEHAYVAPQEPGPINLLCEHLPNGIHFAIIDEGAPMPDGNLPLGMVQDVDAPVEDLPEGGFGWFLIEGLAKDLEYVREDASNRLTFRLAIATSAGG